MAVLHVMMLHPNTQELVPVNHVVLRLDLKVGITFTAACPSSTVPAQTS